MLRYAIFMFFSTLGVLPVSAQPLLTLHRVTPTWPTVEVYFSYTCDGTPAFNARIQNFELHEDNEAVPSFTLSCPDTTQRCPMSIALILDAAASADSIIVEPLIQGAQAFISLMDGITDQAAVVLANPLAHMQQSMTTDIQLLDQAAAMLKHGGASHIWDACILGLNEIAARGNNQCRALILMTDGAANASTHTRTDVIALAQTHHIRVYVIGIGTTVNRQELATLANECNGRFYLMVNPKDAEVAFRDISSTILLNFRECVITYDQRCADGMEKSIELTLKNYCGGTDTKAATYKAPLDSTTMELVRFSLDRVSAGVPGTARLSLSLAAIPQSSTLPPFKCDILFDSTRLSFQGLSSDSRMLLDASDIIRTAIPGGIQLATTEHHNVTMTRLTELVFLTQPALASASANVSIRNLQLSKPCVRLRSDDGWVAAMSNPVPSISRYPLGIVHVTAFPSDSADVGVAVTNTGGKVLNITGHEFSGAAPEQFSLISIMPDSIPAGGKTVLQFRFYSHTPEAAHAFFSINSDDPLLSRLEIPLVGLTASSTDSLLRAQPQLVNFGEVPVSINRDTTLAFSNPGTADVFIRNQQLLGPDASSFQITRGLPARVSVNMESTPTIRFAGDAMGDYVAEYLVEHSAGAPISIMLSAKAVQIGAALVISPGITEIDYDTVYVGDNVPRDFVLSNAGNANLSIHTIALTGQNPDAFRVDIAAPLALTPGERQSMRISFIPTSAGSYTAELDIIASEPEVPPRRLQLAGVAITQETPKLMLSSDIVDFGKTPPNETTSRTLVLENVGGGNLNISDQSVMSDDSAQFSIASMARTTIPPGTMDSIILNFTPLSFGNKEAVLRISSNDPTTPDSDVVLLGVGAALEGPKLLLLQSSLDFDTVLFMNSRELSLHVRNAGDMPLLLTSTRIEGQDADLFSIKEAFSGSIPPGDLDSTVIVFTASREGVASADFIIESNVLAQRITVIPMSANAILSSVTSAAEVYGFILSPAYPNPVSSSVIIPYSLERPGHVIASIVDVLGRTLHVIDEGTLSPGHHRLHAQSEWLSPGMYALVFHVNGLRMGMLMFAKH